MFISLINAIQMFHNLQKAIRQEWLSQNTLLRAHYICKYGFHLLICFVQFRVLSFASHVLCLLVHFKAGRKWIAVIRSILRLLTIYQWESQGLSLMPLSWDIGQERRQGMNRSNALLTMELYANKNTCPEN